MAETLIEVKDLCKYFPVGKKQQLKAVDHVSFSIARGETLGLVGESGCGKTTCGRTLLERRARSASAAKMSAHCAAKSCSPFRKARK